LNDSFPNLFAGAGRYCLISHSSHCTVPDQSRNEPRRLDSRPRPLRTAPVLAYWAYRLGGRITINEL
jgi:hypothetical protein